MEAGRLGAPGLSAVEIAVGESEVERGLARILSPSTEVKPAWEQRRSFRSATSRLAQVRQCRDKHLQAQETVNYFASPTLINTQE